ncbi:MAG: hypothetical protein V3S73_05270 [Gammaproteobacteria bacterium]
MSVIDREKRFLDSVRAELDRSVAHLDAATNAQLNQARRRAFEERAQPLWQIGLLPAGVFATACVALIVFTLAAPPFSGREMILQDVELISSLDSLDLYEDLEFYEWLEAYEQAS